MGHFSGSDPDKGSDPDDLMIRPNMPTEHDHSAPERDPTAEDELRDRLKSLESLPFVLTDHLLAHVDIRTVGQRTVPVEVGKIIGSHGMQNWGDVQRPLSLVADYIRRYESGEFTYERRPPSLFEYGGAYMINADGRTGVVIAKLRQIETITAAVTQVVAEKVVVFKKEDFEEMLRRKEAGLWDGDLLESRPEGLSGWGISFYARGAIRDHQGVWVFSKEMDSVKEAYSRIGASGK